MRRVAAGRERGREERRDTGGGRRGRALTTETGMDCLVVV